MKTVSTLQELWQKDSSRAEEDCQVLNTDAYLCPACIVVIIEIEACVPKTLSLTPAAILPEACSTQKWIQGVFSPQGK